MEKRPVFIYLISHVPNLLFTFCHRPRLIFGKCTQTCSAVLTIVCKLEEGEELKRDGEREQVPSAFCILFISQSLSTVHKKLLPVSPFDFE